jgi:hypothetical protein
MAYQAVKGAAKKFSITSVVVILALSSLAAITPLFLTQSVAAETPPLTVATSCTNSGVLLTLTATNTLGKDALIWFHTDYGSSSEHGFAKNSTKVWTKNTGQATIPAGSVSVDTLYFFGSQTFNANYAAFSCVPEAPSVTTSPVYVNASQSHAMLSWNPSPSSNIASYEYRIFANNADAANDTNPIYISAPVNSTTASAPISATDGTLYWRVTAKSSYGFTSTPSNIGTILVDRTAPQVTSLFTDHSVYGGSRNVIHVAGASNEPESTYAFTLTKNGSPIANQISSNTAWAIPNVHNAAAYPSGTYVISLVVTDKAGNQSSPTSVNIDIDNTGPAIVFTPNGSTYTGTTVQPSLTISDPQGVDETSYVWTADLDNPATLTFDANAKEPTFKPTTPGEYTFYLAATDSLGNQSEVAFSFTWRSIVPTSIGTDSVGGFGSSALTPNDLDAIPAGLVATPFNTTNPDALGITTPQPTDSKKDGQTKAASTEKREKEITEPASNNFAWYWFLLLIAVLVAAYYAYRNWRLNKEK